MNTISLDGYVMVKQDDLQALGQASRHPAVGDPACPAPRAGSTTSGACGAKSRAVCGADPPEPLLTVRQAAQQLSLSPSAVHNYISSHRLPVIRLGRAIRIQPADLAEFIAQRRQNGKDPCPT